MARSASDPLVIVESGSAAELVLRNSHLQNGSGCAHVYPSSGPITFVNVSFADCEEQADVGSTGAVGLRRVDVGRGQRARSGTDRCFGFGCRRDASNFNGEGAIVALNSIGPGFVLSDVEGHVSGQGGIVGEGNEDIILERIHLTGAPGIDVDRTSGLFADITLQGEGSGTAFISHHGRSSDSLVVERLNVSGYSVGVSLHSDPGEISAPLILRDAHVVVSSALGHRILPCSIGEQRPHRERGCGLHHRSHG